MVVLISTRDPEHNKVSYTGALVQGQAPDQGLYVPVDYPQLSMNDLTLFNGMDYKDLVFQVKSRFVGDSIPSADLHTLIGKAYTQEKFGFVGSRIVPVREIGDRFYVQELSHGPAASFKCVALQLFGQELAYELERREENLVMLGATSGDTGSAAEVSVKNHDRIRLFMLSPKEGMSAFQKAQMGMLSGGNIYNISVRGVFDDCQDLVKALKRDPEFAKLGAVNSINWGRISSQVPYYVSGYLQAVGRIGEEVDFVVPSGNFGNVYAGYVAKMMGVPIRRLIIATNENNVLERLVNTGLYKKGDTQKTSSPSMDINKASNFERLLFDMTGRNPNAVYAAMAHFERNGYVRLAEFMDPVVKFKELGFYAGSSTHKDRIEEIARVYRETGQIIDPHTADGVHVARDFVEKGVPIVVMSTAMPVKFEDTIREALGFVPERKERFRGIEERVPDGAFHEIGKDPEELKDYLRRNMNWST